MFDIKDVEIKNIDHLGIVAGIIDSIGLVEIINESIGVNENEKVNAGQVVKAMILNGLGFVSKPLYMFPKYFESIPCEHLIGSGVKAEYLNDDKLGRVMDKLFIKGLDSIFLSITLNVIKKFKISLSTSHLDSSSIHLHGEHNSSLPEVIFDYQKVEKNHLEEELETKSLQPINITYGYSRDHRPDLKQFLIELICSDDGDIPIFLKSASGNIVDSSCFGQLVVDYKKQLQVDSLMVADCALYTEQNIKLMSEIKWLCRVPLSIKEAKLLTSTLPESEFIKSNLWGYSYVAKKITYAGIEQRWLVVQSQERRKADLQKLSQKITKNEEKIKSDLKKLSKEKFACEADAIKELSKLSKKFKYYQTNKVSIIENRENSRKQEKYYQISATIIKDEDKINPSILSAGRFIIATNILEEAELDNTSMIYKYKAQQSCVRVSVPLGSRGFSFLKDPLFFADSIYLKTPERIEALAMIMGLCLLVYKLAQRQLRLALYESQLKFKNQLGKPTDTPTLKWIFQCFQSVHIVKFNNQKQVSNWNEERDFILKLLPNHCLSYYSFIT
ncbi:MAG: IS1634 family transposase [Richelia sp. RM2_1_2]|nr:IS1634 family transposase [Richelia sp. RM2_1_2]